MSTKEIGIQEFMAIIRSGGVPAWNKWYRDHPGTWPENHAWEEGGEPEYGLIHVDLSGIRLGGYDLQGIILDGACFTEAVFEDCNLREASFVCVEATRAAFRRCNLRGACLDFAIVNRADFSGSDLTGSSFDYAVDGRRSILRDAKVGPWMSNFQRERRMLWFRPGTLPPADRARGRGGVLPSRVPRILAGAKIWGRWCDADADGRKGSKWN